MGMTDKQFDAYVRGLINRLEDAIAKKDWEVIVKLQKELQITLES